MSLKVDCVVVGAGVVGLAIARELTRSGREVIVIERADSIGTGISSRSSEVVHAGIYYPRNSLKSRLCIAGRQALYSFCERAGVDYRVPGKIIVATSAEQVQTLDRYAANARDCGVEDLLLLSAVQARNLEEHVSCAAALYSPSTGIVDSHALMLALVGDIESGGGAVCMQTAVMGGELRPDCAVIETGGGSSSLVETRHLINAAGLDAQAVSRRLRGLKPDTVPPLYFAKGSYFRLKGSSPFTHLVYPLAESAGLGIHATLDLAGQIRFGPDVEWVDEIDYTVNESRRAAFGEAIRKYYPDLEDLDLEPAYASIRPKIVGPGAPAADFCIREPNDHGVDSYTALYGIESPGLTSALALASHVAMLVPA